MRFLKEVSSTLISKAVISLIAFGTSIVIARALQPYGKGVLGTMFVTAELAACLGTLGAGTALTFLTAQSQFPRREIASTAAVASVVGAILVAALVIAAGPALRIFILSELAWPTVLGAALFASARAVASYGEGIARGLRHIYACNLGAVLQVGVQGLIVVVLFLFAALTPSAALVALAVSFLLSTFIYVGSFYPRELSLAPTASPRVLRALFTYGAGYQAVGILQMLHFRSDLLLVAHYGGPENAGWYSTAAGLAQILWNIPVAVGYVLMPWASAADLAHAGERTAAATRMTLAVTAAVALTLGVFADTLIRVAYGTAFLPAAAPLRILLPGIVASSVLYVLGSFLMGRGSSRPLIAITGGCVAANLALNVVLIPRLGIQGAALASTLTYTGGSILLVGVASRHTGVPFRHFFGIHSDDLTRTLLGMRSAS